MARTVNKVILLGNIGKAPEVKYLQSGTPVATFSVATSSSYKDKSGEWQEKTEWNNCKAWAKTAEVVEKYLDKGSKVHIIGRLETQSWDDKETGKKVYRTEIVVEELTLLGDKGNGSPKSTGTIDDVFNEDDSDAIPF